MQQFFQADKFCLKEPFSRFRDHILYFSVLRLAVQCPDPSFFLQSVQSPIERTGSETDTLICHILDVFHKCIAVCRAVEAADGLELVARVDEGDGLELLTGAGAEVAVDFTHPAVALELTLACAAVVVRRLAHTTVRVAVT